MLILPDRTMLMVILAPILNLPLEVYPEPKCRPLLAAETLLIQYPNLHSFSLRFSIWPPGTNTPAKKLDSKPISL